jgi:ferritin-like metal-binding protein YciE
MKIDSLQKLFVEELRDLYSAENQILKALPKMMKAATSPELKAAFEKHLGETKGQVERLETIFEKLGEKPKGKTCKAMEGLVDLPAILPPKREGVIDRLSLIGRSEAWQ